MKKQKIVILGGGTGLSTLLKGIKYIDNVDISAIVSVSDDGKSTGILRKHFTIPAVGDLRRVISALSRERIELSEILNYRFENTNSQLDGHTLGNLIIVSQILKNRSFSRGIANTCKMLNVAGEIIPVSNNSLNINALFEDGSIAKGESSIHTHKKKIAKIFYDENDEHVVASSIAIEALKQADLIIIGIGSLYSSILPNLIFKKIIDVLKTSKAHIVYFANIFTENGETDNMSIMDHVKAIENHTFKGIIKEIIVNTSKISDKLTKKYNEYNQYVSKDDTKGHDIKIRHCELLNKTNTEIVRHDPTCVEKVVVEILNDIRSQN